MRGSILILTLILALIAGSGGYGTAQAQQQQAAEGAQAHEAGEEQKKCEEPQELTPKGKAVIEAEIRKHSAFSSSAEFSDWHVWPIYEHQKDSTGLVTVKDMKSTSPPEGWSFRLDADGTLTVGIGSVELESPGFPRYKVHLNDSIGLIEKWSEFIAAVKSGNYQKIKESIAKGSSICARDESGDGVLHIAVRKNLPPSIIKLLMDAGACHVVELSQARQSPSTILSNNKGDKESLRLLEECEQVALSELPPDGDQLAVDTNELVNAVKTGDYEKIKAALANSNFANPAETKDYETDDNLLHIAAKGNFGPNSVKLLLDAGVPPAARNKSNETPLDIYRKKKGNPESIRLLENAGGGAVAPQSGKPGTPPIQGNPPAGSNSGEAASPPQQSSEKIAEPVLNLFRAWANLDHNLYMAQWAPGAIQYDEKGHRQRDLSEISRQRSEDFKKYRRVEMNYRILDTKVTGNTAEIRIEYYMNLTRQDGREIHDGSAGKPNQEIYKLVHDAGTQRWLITENRDYLGRQ